MGVFTKAEASLAAIQSSVKLMRVNRESPVSDLVAEGRRAVTGNDTPFGRYANLEQDDSSRAQRQYQAFKGTAYTAIRPIMNLGAAQSFRVGFAGNRESIAKEPQWGGLYRKWLGDEDYEKECLRVAPDFIRKAPGEGVTPLTDHFLLKLLESPNERLTGYSLKQMSIASIMLTGRMVWWFDTSGAPRRDVPELGSMRLWYVPRSWIRPAQDRSGYWVIQAPGSSTSAEVSHNELFLSTMADPANPFMPFSPLQSQATSVDTDDKILKAQAVSMENAMHPNLVVTMGRLPGMPGNGRPGGQGPRPMLDGKQREQVVEAIKLHLEGVEKWGEPLILDALIESVHKFMPTPAELDMVNSQKVTSQRVMHGLGVSEIIAGQSQSANRAGSTVAEDIFYRVTLNPILAGMSQDMDAILGPRFSVGGRRLRVWIESLETNDAEAIASRVQIGINHLQVGEVREWMATGKLKLNKISDEESKKFVGQSAAGEPQGQGQPAGDGGQGQAANTPAASAAQ